MSDQSEPAGPEERGGWDDGGGADPSVGHAGDAGRGEFAAHAEHAEHSEHAERAGHAGDAGRGDLAGRPGAVAGSGGQPDPGLRATPAYRIAMAVVGPLILLTIYFTVPFDPIGPKHRILPWVIVVGILTLLAIGMVVTTNRAMTDTSGRYRNPGLIILLMSWAATLTFAASYWAMATHEGQFVGLKTRLDALYFTGVTMATVGYGDIHPSGQLGRAVVLVQLLYTFTFLAAGIAAVRTRTRARIVERRKRG